MPEEEELEYLLLKCYQAGTKWKDSNDIVEFIKLFKELIVEEDEEKLGLIEANLTKLCEKTHGSKWKTIPLTSRWQKTGENSQQNSVRWRHAVKSIMPNEVEQEASKYAKFPFVFTPDTEHEQAYLKADRSIDSFLDSNENNIEKIKQRSIQQCIRLKLLIVQLNIIHSVETDEKDRSKVIDALDFCSNTLLATNGMKLQLYAGFLVQLYNKFVENSLKKYETQIQAKIDNAATSDSSDSGEESEEPAYESDDVDDDDDDDDDDEDTEKSSASSDFAIVAGDSGSGSDSGSDSGSEEESDSKSENGNNSKKDTSNNSSSDDSSDSSSDDGSNSDGKNNIKNDDNKDNKNDNKNDDNDDDAEDDDDSDSGTSSGSGSGSDSDNDGTDGTIEDNGLRSLTIAARATRLEIIKEKREMNAAAAAAAAAAADAAAAAAAAADSNDNDDDDSDGDSESSDKSGEDSNSSSVDTDSDTDSEDPREKEGKILQAAFAAARDPAKKIQHIIDEVLKRRFDTLENRNLKIHAPTLNSMLAIKPIFFKTDKMLMYALDQIQEIYNQAKMQDIDKYIEQKPEETDATLPNEATFKKKLEAQILNFPQRLPLKIRDFVGDAILAPIDDNTSTAIAEHLKEILMETYMFHIVDKRVFDAVVELVASYGVPEASTWVNKHVISEDTLRLRSVSTRALTVADSALIAHINNVFETKSQLSRVIADTNLVRDVHNIILKKYPTGLNVPSAVIAATLERVQERNPSQQPAADNLMARIFRFGVPIADNNQTRSKRQQQLLAAVEENKSASDSDSTDDADSDDSNHSTDNVKTAVNDAIEGILEIAVKNGDLFPIEQIRNTILRSDLKDQLQNELEKYKKMYQQLNALYIDQDDDLRKALLQNKPISLRDIEMYGEKKIKEFSTRVRQKNTLKEWEDAALLLGRLGLATKEDIDKWSDMWNTEYDSAVQFAKKIEEKFEDLNVLEIVNPFHPTKRPHFLSRSVEDLKQTNKFRKNKYTKQMLQTAKNRVAKSDKDRIIFEDPEKSTKEIAKELKIAVAVVEIAQKLNK